MVSTLGVENSNLESRKGKALYDFLDKKRQEKHLETLMKCKNELPKAAYRAKESREDLKALIQKDMKTAKIKFESV